MPGRSEHEPIWRSLVIHGLASTLAFSGVVLGFRHADRQLQRQIAHEQATVLRTEKREVYVALAEQQREFADMALHVHEDLATTGEAPGAQEALDEAFDSLFKAWQSVDLIAPTVVSKPAQDALGPAADIADVFRRHDSPQLQLATIFAKVDEIIPLHRTFHRAARADLEKDLAG